jgi:hypothetical protein
MDKYSFVSKHAVLPEDSYEDSELAGDYVPSYLTDDFRDQDQQEALQARTARELLG